MNNIYVMFMCVECGELHGYHESHADVNKCEYCLGALSVIAKGKREDILRKVVNKYHRKITFPNKKHNCDKPKHIQLEIADALNECNESIKRFNEQLTEINNTVKDLATKVDLNRGEMSGDSLRRLLNKIEGPNISVKFEVGKDGLKELIDKLKEHPPSKINAF